MRLDSFAHTRIVSACLCGSRAQPTRCRAGSKRLGDDVLERGPGEEQEDGVVEGEEARGTCRPRAALAPDAADDDRDRRAAGRGAAGSARARGRRRPSRPVSVPTAQMPTSASATAATVRQPTVKKKSPNAGSATSSARARKAKTEIALPSQIALRSHGAMTSASKRPCSRSGTNARVSPSSAVKMIAVQSSPSPTWWAWFAFAGTREVEDRQGRDHEQQHRRDGLLRPQLDQEVLARERARRPRSSSRERQPLRSRDARPAPGRGSRRRPPRGRRARRASRRGAPSRPRRAR